MQALAFFFKILAIVFWLGSTWFVLNFDVRDVRASSPPHYRDAPRDWGTPAYYRRTYYRIAETAILLLLALTPNRPLVSSRIGFGIVFAVALIPFVPFLFTVELPSGDIGEVTRFVFGLMMIIGMFSPLPLSLLFSFLRRRKGETISYA